MKGIAPMNKTLFAIAALAPALVASASSVSIDGEWDFRYFADVGKGKMGTGSGEWSKLGMQLTQPTTTC